MFLFTKKILHINYISIGSQYEIISNQIRFNWFLLSFVYRFPRFSKILIIIRLICSLNSMNVTRVVAKCQNSEFCSLGILI